MFLAVGFSLVLVTTLALIQIKTLFGTNFFDFEGGNIHIANNFWIYVVMAIGMSGFTVLLWVLYQRKRKSRARLVPKDIEAGEKS